jgi:uncharacterized membrane protein
MILVAEAARGLRPDDWDLPLFIHVLGAFTLVGALVTAATFLFAARHDGSLAFVRNGFRCLLLAALPAFIATRVGAQWIADEEGLDDADVAFVEIGYISTDVGLLVLLGATIAAGIAVRRAGRADGGDPRGGAAIAAWLVTLLIAVYAVVIWLMATKPT